MQSIVTDDDIKAENEKIVTIMVIKFYQNCLFYNFIFVKTPWHFKKHP